MPDKSAGLLNNFSFNVDACAEVSKVATHINECLRLHENFNKMLCIQNSLVGDGAPRILAPGSSYWFL